MERNSTNWLGELPQCPQKKDLCKSDEWEEATKANQFHPGGAFDVRSIPTSGGHSSQCVYDAAGNLMTNIPSAGSADYRACPNPPFCMDHYLHDVAPFNYANDLGRVNEYFDVRPVR